MYAIILLPSFDLRICNQPGPSSATWYTSLRNSPAFNGRIGLEINEILMWRGAGHVDHDHSLMIAPHARSLLGSEQLRQGQTAERPHAQEIPSAPAITMGGVALSTYLKHVLFFATEAGGLFTFRPRLLS